MRLCKKCDTDTEVEDEIHFLFKCDVYNRERLSLFNQVPELSELRTETDQLKYLLTHKPYVLSNYVYDLWQIRNSQ